MLADDCSDSKPPNNAYFFGTCLERVILGLHGILALANCCSESSVDECYPVEALGVRRTRFGRLFGPSPYIALYATLKDDHS
jgi:hypothetical protein